MPTGYRKIPITVNVEKGAIVNPSNGQSLSASAIPVLFYNEIAILCLSFVNNSLAPYPVSESDIFEFSGDSNFIHSDGLAVFSENDQVDIAGDWSGESGINRSLGRISVRVNTLTVPFSQKYPSKKDLYIQLDRYPAGSSIPSKMLQDKIYGKPSVSDNEGSPESSDPEYWTASQIAAKLREGRDLQFSIDGATLWHETQTAADRYWQERYPDGEWSVAIEMIQGIQGVTGAAATLAIGTIETLEPGANATASNSGTTYAAILNIAIPRGHTGAIGATGAEITSGEFSGDDLVFTRDNGATFGITGAAVTLKGNIGVTGAAATLDIGTITTLEPGQTATAENVGTIHVAIFNLAVPRGHTGADSTVPGPQGNTGATGATPSYYADYFTAADLTGGHLIINHTDGLISGLPYAFSRNTSGLSGATGEYENVVLDDIAIVFGYNSIDADLSIYDITGGTGWHYVFGAVPGEDGATGATGIGVTGAEIVSAAFVGNDLVFTRSDAVGVTLTNAKLEFKGETGANSTVPGPAGTTGADNTRTDIASYTGGHTMGYADKGVYMRFTGATACSVIFPQGLTFASGDKGDFFQAGAGTLTIAGVTGVYLNDVEAGSCDIAMRRQGAYWVCTASDYYDIGGTVMEVT